MAKRNVEYGVIEPENLQEWASAQTAGGTFMLTPNVTKGVPYTRYWRGILTVASLGIDRGLLIFTSEEMYRTDTSGGKWTAPWRAIADCIAPEVHDLPLYSGYTNLGCKYFRTQENVVSFAGEVMRTSGFRADETFAVLPEGFRPDHTIVVPALLYPSYTPTTIIIKSNGEICETTTSSDKSLYMQATFAAS